MKKATSDYFIGIDIGTSCIKSVVYNVDFQMEAYYEQNYMYEILENEHIEIDPSVWVFIVKEQLSLIFKTFSHYAIKGIGITGQMHTTVFLDKNHQSIRPAILWNDKRTTKIVEQIKKTLPKTAETENTISILSTGSPLANLVWLKEEDPTSYQKLETILFPKDYVRLALTGTIATDYCDASTSGLFDIINEKWSKEIQDFFHFPSNIFPKVEPAGNVAGFLNLNFVGIQDTTLIPVAIGTGDNFASIIANRENGNCAPILSLGTSGVFILPDNKINWKQHGKNIITKVFSEDSSIMTQGSLQCGAKVLDWWSSQITEEEIIEMESRAFKKIGSESPIFFPYLNGDKTVYQNPNLKGAFFDLTFSHTKDDLTLAIYEGVTFAMRTLVEKMEEKTDKRASFLFIGGGSKSSLWPFLLANNLHAPILLNEQSREACLGSAILGYIACCGAYPKISINRKTIEPDSTWSHYYNQRYTKFKEYSSLLTQRKNGGEQ